MSGGGSELCSCYGVPFLLPTNCEIELPDPLIIYENFEQGTNEYRPPHKVPQISITLTILSPVEWYAIYR